MKTNFMELLGGIAILIILFLVALLGKWISGTPDVARLVGYLAPGMLIGLIAGSCVIAYSEKWL